MGDTLKDIIIGAMTGDIKGQAEKAKAEENLKTVNSILNPLGLDIRIGHMPDDNRSRHEGKFSKEMDSILRKIENMAKDAGNDDADNDGDRPDLPDWLTAERVFYNGRNTVVKWADGTITKVSCAKGDKYSRGAGLAFAYMKKVAGNNHNGLKYLLAPAGDESNVQKTKEEHASDRAKAIEKAKAKKAAQAEKAARAEKPEN